MCGDVKRLPRETKELYEIASSILGYDLLDLCANGPIEKLNQTVYCQPAVFISSLAAIDRLRDKNPESIDNCVCTAGFSVGEFTALVFSGVLSLEDGVRIVKARAEAMQLQSEMVQGGMATVLYGADSKLSKLLSCFMLFPFARTRDVCFQRFLLCTLFKTVLIFRLCPESGP